MTGDTVAAARQYWDRYYNEEFVFGMGTEDILTALLSVPPVRTWLDLGAGSESLLWSIPLRTEHLIAVDIDPTRLALLRTLAATARPRRAYRTVLEFCDRTEADFTARCAGLAATAVADCMSGTWLPFRPASADLITQFGLLGLATDREAFLHRWHRAHEVLAAGGWCAGANWTASATHRHGIGRITLDRSLFTAAFAASGITPLHLECVPIHGDADFASVWIYLGRRP